MDRNPFGSNGISDIGRCRHGVGVGKDGGSCHDFMLHYWHTYNIYIIFKTVIID